MAFFIIENMVEAPMINLRLFRIRAFFMGSGAGFLMAVARGGFQFMLIIWLQGIWLPLHGYNYSDTPLWAGIFLLPLTVGFLLAGPISGYLVGSSRRAHSLDHRAQPLRAEFPRPSLRADELLPTGSSPSWSSPTASAAACSPRPTPRLS